MSIPVPTPIATYIAASNSRDIDAMIACFAVDAVVVDESQTHRGPDAIRAWLRQTRDAYQFTMEPIAFEEGSEAILTCTVSGNFDGSPIDLRYFFTFNEDKISTLTIRD